MAELSSVGVSALVTAAKATGTITFSGVGSDACTITIGDGTRTVVFELDSNSTFTAGRTPVTIGASAAATAANLCVAINNSVLDVEATISGAVVTVTASHAGTAYNVTITEAGDGSSAVALTGMSGGVGDFVLTKLGDGGHRFRDTAGNLVVMHSDHPDVARLYAALAAA
jgi:hypothetical protein